MADIKVGEATYKLRAGSPMPIDEGVFILHTFMSETNEVDNYVYTDSLPDSSEFRGQFGEYFSANFSRMLDVGGNGFAGKITHSEDYIDEAYLGGLNSGDTVY